MIACSLQAGSFKSAMGWDRDGSEMPEDRSGRRSRMQASERGTGGGADGGKLYRRWSDSGAWLCRRSPCCWVSNGRGLPRPRLLQDRWRNSLGQPLPWVHHSAKEVAWPKSLLTLSPSLPVLWIFGWKDGWMRKERRPCHDKSIDVLVGEDSGVRKNTHTTQTQSQGGR